MLHDKTRDYTRKLLQSQLEALTHRLSQLGADDAKAINDTVIEIRDVSNYIADLMTHHLDNKPAEQPREVRAALHLYQNVLKSFDPIREIEVSLGLSEKANTRPHNFLRELRKFIEGERMARSGEVISGETVKALAESINGQLHPPSG